MFVDTGAWIALALVRDPLHERAVDAWDELIATGARLRTSVPVVLETFTFLDRHAARDVALAWKESLEEVETLSLLECASADLERAWPYFARTDLHKLSAVDATSFAIMEREGIRRAFAFDHHFAAVGFLMVG
ncbi:MAG TPA: PIN domain-containing protein [Thermoanaerobaculia bacterium]|nr:PIN domain-containing protein [Thermoanaerobaculia bacterium]